LALALSVMVPVALVAAVVTLVLFSDPVITTLGVVVGQPPVPLQSVPFTTTGMFIEIAFVVLPIVRAALSMRLKSAI